MRLYLPSSLFFSVVAKRAPASPGEPPSRSGCSVVFVGALGWLCLALHAAEPREAKASAIALTDGPQLFIDDYLIAASSGLRRTTHQPVRVAQPVMRDERPLFYMKVAHDADRGRFRMWYNRMDPVLGYAYAESRDGITWERPDLGIVDLPGAQHQNALGTPTKCFGLFLFDEGHGYTPPAERFKMAYYRQKSTQLPATGMWVAFSADGLRFDDPIGRPVIAEYAEGETGGISDIIEGLWDPRRREYLVICKRWEAGHPGKPANAKEGMRRVVGLTSSRDFRQWENPVTILRPAPENGLEEFYGCKPILRGDLYLGFLRVLRDDLPADKGGAVQGIGWTELATSRDGRKWTRQPGKFLDRDPRTGEWDHAMAWFGDCVTVGDKDYIYYGGYSTGHKGGGRQLGLAILRRNGFVSRDADAGGGTLRTPRLALTGRTLTINASIRGEIRLRLLDAAGRPLPGYDWADAEPLQGDSLAHRVRWRDRSALPADVAVSLEFSLRDAALYGFDLQSRD